MFLQAETLVGDLIDKEKACWKTEVLDALFLPHEAEEIKKIPLSSHLPTDKQILACSHNGVFTVRSLIGWLVRCQGLGISVPVQMKAEIGSSGQKFGGSKFRTK